MSPLENLRLYLHLNDLDAVLLSSTEQIVYISGFSGFSHTERDGYVLITKHAGYILTSPLYSEGVRSTVSDLSCLEFTATDPLTSHLQKLVRKHRLKRVGFEEDNLRVSEWKRLKTGFPTFLPVNLSMLRITKSPEEVRLLKLACRVADTALTELLPNIRPGLKEVDVVLMLEDAIRKQTADIAFPTIVAFGKNAAIPHHKSNETKLKKNDTVLIDFGAAYREYRSDMTRTFFVGRVPDEQRKAYQAVLYAQQAAIKYIQKQLDYSSSERSEARSSQLSTSAASGGLRSNNKILASGVDKVSRDYLVSQGYPSIPHSLGHGIGLAVHEAPRLGPNSDDILEEGMVFSIEPGIYLPRKFGIRIEDLYTIHDGKLLRLTQAPSRLTEI